jgi:predicted metal-dependent hydrolase
MQPETVTGPAPIKPRRFEVDYGADTNAIPRHWAGDAFLTHWLNAYTLTIPDGENYIVKTLKTFLDELEDPELERSARGLIGQEMTHSRGHLRFFDVLRRQGFKLDTYLGFTRFISFRLLEPTATRIQRLAFVVGIERMNELFAEINLGSGKLRQADPAVRALYEWHFAEEIEHKSVAFDVYQAVSGQRLWLAYGVTVCYLVNMAYLFLGCATFLRQDGQLFRWRVWKSAFRYFFSQERFLPRITRGCWQALRRGFHPSHSDNRQLAEHVLSQRVITAEPVSRA